MKENRADVGVIEERHLGASVVANTPSVSSREVFMLEYPRTFPNLAVYLPVALPSCAFSVPVLALGCEPERALYTYNLTAAAVHPSLFDVFSDHRVGACNRKRCNGCCFSESSICGSPCSLKFESRGKNVPYNQKF